MARYLVNTLLWSQSLNRYVIPGEVIALSESAAAPLLKKGAIEPIEHEIKQELDDDTDK